MQPSATFPDILFSTICALSYTDGNGGTVAHSFDASTTFGNVQGINEEVGGGQVSAIAEPEVFGQHSPFSGNIVWFDRNGPAVVLSGTSGTIGGACQTVTATFSKNVTGFTEARISLDNLTVSNFTVMNAAEYRFLVTPIASGRVSALIEGGSATDVVGYITIPPTC